MARLIKVLDPTMAMPTQARGLAPRVETVVDKTVGLRVTWPRFRDFSDRFEELLQQRCQPKEVVRVHRELIDHKGRQVSPHAEEFFARAEWAVLGLAA